jgi:hypothetical protein
MFVRALRLTPAGSLHKTSRSLYLLEKDMISYFGQGT